MRYKTMILELLQARPQLGNLLQQQRRMLQAVEGYADQLKLSHLHWQDQLRLIHPASDPAQIASEALELALAEIQHHLSSESAVVERAHPEQSARPQAHSPHG
jgi:hypothetical protein